MIMKKAGIVILLTACILGLIFFLQGNQEKRVEVADCLPADVLFYGEQLDFTDMYQEFLNSRLGRTLTRLDYSGIAAELGESEEAILELEESWRKVIEVLDGPGFNELLGKEFSVAVFPANSFSAANPAKAIEERLLLIARPRHNAQLLQFLALFLSKDIPQSTVKYGTHTITRYQIDEENTLSTATIKGLVLAGFEERLVRKSIDHYDNKKDILSDNIEFQRLRKSFKGAKMFTYLSFPAVSKQGRMIGKDLPEEDQDEFFALLEQWDGWGAAAYGAWNGKGVVKDKAEILFDQSKLDSRVAKLCDVKPGENKTLKLVPADTLFYYWTNTLNLPLIWELYSSSTTRQQPEALDILRHELRDSAGVDLEELLDTIGNEFALIVEDIDSEGIPLPKATGIVQLREPEKFLKVFNILLQNADIPVSLNTYQGQDITYWGVVPQGGLQPAFTLIENYLFISNSIDFVKQIVDLQTDPSRNLLNSSAMEEVGRDLLKPNNSATYIHIAKLADSLKDLAAWAGAMAVLQGPEMARNADIVVNQLVLPLLDGVAMYTQLGSRSIVTPDSIVLESTTTIVQ
jgi:Protein of unknown function (DUF3352)